MNTYSATYRHAQQGPSLIKHALAAMLTLLIVPLALWAFVHFKGDSADAISRGQIHLAEAPPKPNIYNLNTAQTDLPDILELDDVATIEIRPADDLAGEDGTQTEQAPPRTSNPPAVPMIDGRPLGDGETRIGETPPGKFVTLPRPTGPLPRAPIAGLSRPSPFGDVPAPNRRGLTPLAAYSKPYTVQRGRKTVSLIVGGLGINNEQTRRAINGLPPEVTLSFAAHASNLQSWINQARAKGHEVMIELPMEPYNFDPSTPNSQYTLRSDVTASVNIRNLDYLLSRAQGYFGVTNYLGEKFYDSGSSIGPVIGHIRAAGLGLIYDGVGQNEVLSAAAKANKLPWVHNRSVIDINPDQASITRILTALEGSANGKTIAIGMGFAYPATIDAIIAWSDGLESRKISLAPASAALK